MVAFKGNCEGGGGGAIDVNGKTGRKSYGYSSLQFTLGFQRQIH